MQQRGFNTTELIVVVAILVILAAVVTSYLPKLIEGLQGAKCRAYLSDQHTIETWVNAFLTSSHGYSATDGGWNEKNNFSSFWNYPTRYGNASNLELGWTATDMGKCGMWCPVMNGTYLATTNDIEAAAIWMGLLTEEPGSGTGIGNVTDTKDNTAPLPGEDGPYLKELPKSCSAFNSSKGRGNYTWIVDAYGSVRGVFEIQGVWYDGFNGRYP